MSPLTTLLQNFVWMISVSFLITVTHIEATDDDVIPKSFEAKWFNKVSVNLYHDFADSLKKERKPVYPNVTVQNLIDLLKEESAAEGKQVDTHFYQGLEDLKTDPDFTKIVSEFEDGLNNKRNIMTIGTGLPEFEKEEEPRIKDVGLRGEVFTGEESETENDLIRYSNYISGAGTTFGGFMAGAPQQAKDLIEGGLSATNYKYEVLSHKLKTGIEVLRDENYKAVVNSDIDPEIELRVKRTGVEDLQDTVLSESFDKIKAIEGISDKQRLTQQNINTQKKVVRQRLRTRAKKIAGKILRKVGNGVEPATTAFSLFQGGVDTAAGQNMIDKARNLKAQKGISQDKYDEMLRNGKLRIAQGSFGIASGMKNVAQFVGKRVEKNILKKAGEAVVKNAKRFGSFVGGLISMGTGATSMLKNAYAASDAAKAGIVGKSVMYGVMAAFDGITVVLDFVSVVCDLIFPPLGPIIDLFSTILQVVNTILGFFADLVDFRTTKERVRDEFNTYVDSQPFKTYVNNLASEYKERGFDIFKYYVDADVAGIEGDKATLQAQKKTITKALTNKAKKDFNNKNLRIALVDSTSSGKTHRGRANDDEIIAGFGPDRIYGEEGDDIMFGRGGDDTIYGGPGNDYLNGGTGRDILLGGTGDDVIVCEPAEDLRCEGGEGDDILALSGKPLIYKEDLWNEDVVTMGPEWKLATRPKFPVISPVKGIYLDIGYTSGSGSSAQKGRSGITLGSCFLGWPDGFNKFIHKPAFLSLNDNLEQEFVKLFEEKNPEPLGNADELKSKMLWFLAEKKGVKYFCDGTSFYSVSTSSMQVAKNAVNSIPTSYASYEDQLLKYSKEKKVEALLVFAFRRSFTLDKFEKISAARPDNLAILAHYIPTTVIGSNDHNVIDVSYGLGDVVYTGEGNNVISVGSTIHDYYYTESVAARWRRRPMSFGFYNWAKYIVGGSGYNTLVIQFMNPGNSVAIRSEYLAWQLRNIDKPFVVARRSPPYETHVAYLKNIQTVEIGPLPPAQTLSRKTFKIDAENYDGARRYIINDGTGIFKGPLSKEKDVIVLPKTLSRTRYILFGKNTKNTISFQYYEDKIFSIETVNIYQRYKYDKGKVTMKEKQRPWKKKSVWLVNAMNVISSPTCKNIIGNEKENLIIAVGGRTAIDARDGADTLVSIRGRHELTGGPGLDSFVLHGPEVVEYLTISVVMGEDGKTIRCKTTIYGKWKRGRLEINMLKDDHADVLLKAVEIIPTQGDEGKNLGIISKDATNRKLIFRPGSNFNYLKKNEAKVLRIKYITTGSFATIKEEDGGNQLLFESIKELDDLTASIENDYLVFKDKSNPPRTVLIDHEWSKKLKTGVSTNLFDLILDFAERFPLILFRKNDQEYNQVTSKDTIKFLYKHLKDLETALGQEFDTILDSTSPLLSNVGAEIDVGNGQNIILAQTRGKTYKLGSKSSGSIIVANKFTQGKGKSIIKGGYDPNSLNAVVVGVGSQGVVDINMGPHDVIITGASQNEVQLSRRNGVVYLKDSRQRVLIAGWQYHSCKKLIFKKSTSSTNENTKIIFDCDTYIDRTLRFSKPFKTITVSYGSDHQLKLNCPFTKDNAIIHMRDDVVLNVLRIFFTDRESSLQVLEEDHPYMVVPSDIRIKSFSLKMLYEAMRTRFKAGIKFKNELVKDREICRFLVKKNKTRGGISLSGNKSLRNGNLEC